MHLKTVLINLMMFCGVCTTSCKDDKDSVIVDPVDPKLTYYGADLSSVNQVLDHGGVYRDDGKIQNPYNIFSNHGTNLVRLRLWHTPAWTKAVYGEDGKQLYNDLADVEKSIMLAKAQGMQVLLDFHYSDTWADPAKQYVPAAWADIISVDDLKDSIYNYTYKTLSYLNNKGLMPELVQIGNETNCGMFFSEVKAGFPSCNICDGQGKRLGDVMNKAIAAVRAVSAISTTKTKVVLHVADPKNVEWWFDNIKGVGGVIDFDIVGFSYYPIWHTTVTPDQLSESISSFKSKYGKEVMILETAFPFTPDGNDNYTNSFGGSSSFAAYPFTQQGQYDMMRKLEQELIDGGGIGLIYWEPAWITSNMRDLWGTGSSFENCAFFDFNGNTVKAATYME